MNTRLIRIQNIDLLSQFIRSWSLTLIFKKKKISILKFLLYCSTKPSQMSTSTTKLGDKFLCILKLNMAGINWVVYKDRFLWSIDARGLLEHLEGTKVEPEDPINTAIRADVVQMLVDTEWKKAVKE